MKEESVAAAIEEHEDIKDVSDANKLSIDNEVTKLIKIKNGYLFIKLNKKREFKEEVDIDKQVAELANKEMNRQLNSFSMIFFKRLKKNIQINEL